MYWGNADISVTFCENKYDTAYFIAEFYNTLSSLFYIFVSLFFIKKNYKIGASVLFIGIGSVLLHGTNRIYGEWVDEISMLCFSYFIIQHMCLLNNIYFSNIYLILLIIIYLLFSNYYMVFLTLFISLQIYISYLVYIHKYFETIHSLILFLIAGIFWLFDQLNCDIVRPYYFHVIWHIFTAFSIYLSVQKLLKIKKQNIIPL